VISTLEELFSYPFMVHALIAGTAVALLASMVGWFAVLRRQTFTAHTLGIVGFPGASLAALLGVSVTTGYVAFALLAAGVMAWTSERGRAEHDEAATVGIVQAFALASGFLFISLGHQNVSSAQALLFGSILGVTATQAWALAVIAAALCAMLALAARPLLFTSLDRQVAMVRGVRTHLLDVCFLAMLAIAAGVASQIVGALLAFALLVVPAATAQVLANRVGVSLLISGLIALLATWSGLVAAYLIDVPVGFVVPTLAFSAYVLAQGWRRLQTRRAVAPLGGV
jgi:zinc/manganese transport system permease protein